MEGSPNSTQNSAERKERKTEKKRKKERKKGEKKGKEKEGGNGCTQTSRFFSYLGHSLPRGHSMAMELSPKLGAGSAQFGTNYGRFFWAFYARNYGFVQVEPPVCYTCMMDFFFFVVILASKKKKPGKKIPVCVFLFLFKRHVIFRENVDIGMHAIRLNLLENTMDDEFLCTIVYYLENRKEFPICMCRVFV